MPFFRLVGLGGLRLARGKQPYAQNNTDTDYRYTAQRFDNKLGIYDYRARYYDPYINQCLHHWLAKNDSQSAPFYATLFLWAKRTTP